jgi:carboxyl-terminal processing protease
MKHLRRMFIVLICLVMIGLNHFSLAANAEGSTGSTKINEILQLLSNNHISGASEDQLTDAAIKGMIDSLHDPYTQYFTKEEESQFLDAVSGRYLGIGIQTEVDGKSIAISDVISGASADQSGLVKGDQLQDVNGNNVTPDNINDLFQKASAGKKEGDTVTLTVIRGAETKQVTVSFKNMEVPIVTSQLLSDGVGYISLLAFSGDADKAFAASLQELKNKGMKSLIIDLRNNGGGYIETARAIASHFIQDQPLMITKDRDGKENTIAVKDGTKAAYPIVILVNGYTASASEVFAGAMQDYKLAQIVGVQTYGKGVTQNVIPLFNGGALKITTEEYYTPNHHPVNHIGIKPDIEASGPAEQLVKAFYAAGAKDVELNLTNAAFKMNNTVFPGYGETQYIRSNNGKTYVSTRLLIAMIAGNVSWDNASSTIYLTKDNKKLSLPIASANIMVRNGISFLDASVFINSFPQLKETHADNSLTLKASH